VKSVSRGIDRIGVTFDDVNADRKLERAPIEYRSTLVWKLAGDLGLVHGLAA
jgi:hypothetical protein